MEPDGFTCALFRWNEGNKILPIWIDADDAIKIQAYQAGFEPTRPTAHELLAEAFQRLTPWVSSLQIVSHFEGVFIAAITTSGGEQFDARPSDVIVLSQLLEVPISIDEEILQQSSFFINDENLEEYFGIIIDRSDSDSNHEEVSASGDAQADADFQQLMQSLGVSEDDLFSAPDEPDNGATPEDRPDNS